MQNHLNRYSTFKDWSEKDLVTKLVNDGFYFTGNGDVTKCAFCGIEISNWKSISVEPTTIHMRINKMCPINTRQCFANEIDRINSYVNWPKHNINIKMLSKYGFFYCGSKDIVQCFSCNIKLEDWDEDDNPELVHKNFNKKCQFIDDVIEKSKSTALCDICYSNTKNICFLPCAHIVCCSDCSSKNITECPICKTVIKTKMKVFI